MIVKTSFNGKGTKISNKIYQNSNVSGCVGDSHKGCFEGVGEEERAGVEACYLFKFH